MRPEPNGEELLYWLAGSHTGRQSAVEGYAARTGLATADAKLGLRLYGMGETWASIEPMHLLTRLRALEGK